MAEKGITVAPVNTNPVDLGIPMERPRFHYLGIRPVEYQRLLDKPLNSDHWTTAIPELYAELVRNIDLDIQVERDGLLPEGCEILVSIAAALKVTKCYGTFDIPKLSAKKREPADASDQESLAGEGDDANCDTNPLDDDCEGWVERHKQMYRSEQ